MSKRLPVAERREQLLAVLHQMHLEAKQQTDFTASKMAQQAGVSAVLIYRLVGHEFKTMRSQLPGPRHLRDEEVWILRQKNAELERHLREAQKKLRTTALSELEESIVLLERYEQENLQLRDEIKLLRQRLSEGGQIVVTLPPNKP